MTAPDGLPPLREVVARHGLEPRKALGQNFLYDLNLTGRIARAAGPLAGVTVLEVGPGPGGLTRALLAEGAARVIAVERDPRALPALAEIAAHYPGRLTVVDADALAFDPRPLIGDGPARIVANLPYNVGTALLTGWLEGEAWPPWWDSRPASTCRSSKPPRPRTRWPPVPPRSTWSSMWARHCPVTCTRYATTSPRCVPRRRGRRSR